MTLLSRFPSKKSRDSDDTFLKFTINFGVFCKRIESEYEPDDEHASHYSIRIYNGDGEVWLTINAQDDPELIVDEMNEIIDNTLEPSIAAYNSCEALCELWETGVSPGITAVQRDRYLALLR